MLDFVKKPKILKIVVKIFPQPFGKCIGANFCLFFHPEDKSSEKKTFAFSGYGSTLPCPTTTSGRSSIRIYGINSPGGFLEFSEWMALQEPTVVGKWNVMCVRWCPPGKPSLLWVKYVKDHRGGKMLEFDGAKTAGRTMVIGNHSSGGYMFNGWIADLEVYGTVEMCEENSFVQLLWCRRQPLRMHIRA